MSVQEPCRFCFGSGINNNNRVSTSCTCHFCNGTGVAKSSNEDILLTENKMLKERILELELKLENYEKSKSCYNAESMIRHCRFCNNTKKTKMLFPSEHEIDCPFFGDMKNEN